MKIRMEVSGSSYVDWDEGFKRTTEVWIYLHPKDEEAKEFLRKNATQYRITETLKEVVEAQGGRHEWWDYLYSEDPRLELFVTWEDDIEGYTKELFNDDIKQVVEAIRKAVIEARKKELDYRIESVEELEL